MVLFIGFHNLVFSPFWQYVTNIGGVQMGWQKPQVKVQTSHTSYVSLFELTHVGSLFSHMLSEFSSYVSFVLRYFEKWLKDGNMCENNDHYWMELWVGQVDQLSTGSLYYDHERVKGGGDRKGRKHLNQIKHQMCWVLVLRGINNYLEYGNNICRNIK